MDLPAAIDHHVLVAGIFSFRLTPWRRPSHTRIKFSPDILIGFDLSLKRPSDIRWYGSTAPQYGALLDIRVLVEDLHDFGWWGG
jgi:hypothetical protein